MILPSFGMTHVSCGHHLVIKQWSWLYFEMTCDNGMFDENFSKIVFKWQNYVLGTRFFFVGYQGVAFLGLTSAEFFYIFTTDSFHATFQELQRQQPGHSKNKDDLVCLFQGRKHSSKSFSLQFSKRFALTRYCYSRSFDLLSNETRYKASFLLLKRPNFHPTPTRVCSQN